MHPVSSGKFDQSNVLSILSSAQKCDEKDLVDQCWKVIEEQPQKAVDAKRKTILTSKTETGYLSKLLHGEKSTYYGFEVLFEKKIPLNKSNSYGIRALISGSPSLRGVNCVGSVQCSGVTFTFSDSVFSSNGTDGKQGQFAELLFCL